MKQVWCCVLAIFLASCQSAKVDEDSGLIDPVSVQETTEVSGTVVPPTLPAPQTSPSSETHPKVVEPQKKSEMRFEKTSEKKLQRASEKKIAQRDSPKLAKKADQKSISPTHAATKSFFRAYPLQRKLKNEIQENKERYKAELLKVIQAKKIQLTSHKTSKGESLQSISEKLYGTTRRWPEIYILNYPVLDNYDRLPVGMDLQVIQPD